MSSTVQGTFYIYADHIDTPRVIVNSADNAVVWRWDSADPFGLQGPDENPGGTGAFTYNPRFPGQLFDRESNNHYNYFRDYDPQTGRYIQSDPVGLDGGINTYAYVRSDPVGLFDPNGLAPKGGPHRSGGSGTIPKDFGKNKPMNPVPTAKQIKQESERIQEHGQNLGDIAKCYFGLNNCEAEAEISNSRICILAECTSTCPAATFTIDYRNGKAMAYDPATTTCKCKLTGWKPDYVSSPLPGLGAPGR